MTSTKRSSIKEFRIQKALGTLEDMPKVQADQLLMNLNFLGRIKLMIWCSYVYRKRFFNIYTLKIIIPYSIKYILYCDLGDNK